LTAKLNLITRMSMAPRVVYPATQPEQVMYNTGVLSGSPFDEATPQTFRLDAPPVAVSDVDLVVWARAMLVQTYQRVVLFLNGQAIDQLWLGFGSGGACAEGGSMTERVIAQQVWNDNVDEGSDAELKFAISGNAPGDCPSSWIQMYLSYTYAKPGSVGTSYVSWATYHKTLVTAPGETPGVPHHHLGEWRFDRRSGCLAVWNQSHRQRVTISGANVSPVSASTRPGPACLESVCTGELGGVATRFVADGACGIV